MISIPSEYHRVKALVPHRFTFLAEPMAAVRLNYNARYTAKVGSPEWNYIRWKDDMRNLFDQLDYRDYAAGIPFDEPLSISGYFKLSENVDKKDLDNLVKAILDAMNPARKKNWKDLRTHLWVDDRQIKRFGEWSASPSILEPGTSLYVTPLWGRMDPLLHYIDGTWDRVAPDMLRVTTALKYQFTCRTAEWENPAGAQGRMWVLSSNNGLHSVVTQPEMVVFWREAQRIAKATPAFATSLLDSGWARNLDFLAGSSKGFTGKPLRVMSQVREIFQDPLKRMFDLAEKFDQARFEKVASEVSQNCALPWGSVRSALTLTDLNWRGDVDFNAAAAAIGGTSGKSKPKSKPARPRNARSK